MASADLLQLRVALFPYAHHQARAWSLRENLTIYDAAYVGLAESLDTPLVTLDGRLGRAPGLRCVVQTPPDVTDG